MRPVLLALAAAAVASACSSTVHAEETDAPVPPTLVEVGLDWKRPPSLYDMARFYPVRARSLNITRGEAVVDCTAKAGGKLACVLADEYPAEGQFGDAALKVMKPATVIAIDGGAPEGRSFRFALKFGVWPPHLLPDFARLDEFGLRWVRTPLVTMYWRGAGLPRGQSFTVDLACVVDARGAICEVTDDRYASQGYARGVVKAMARARVDTLDGEPVEGRTFTQSMTMSAD